MRSARARPPSRHIRPNGSCSRATAVRTTRYAEGVDEPGEPIEVVDRLRDRLVAIARRQRDEPDAFIANRELFGDLVDDRRFADAYRSALRSLHERGARATLQAIVT